MRFIKRSDKQLDRNIVKKISSHFNITEKIAEILVDRGYNTIESANSFLRPSWNDFNDPFLFRDMKKVIDIIRKKIALNEKIVVWGDFDCDGVCSTSTLALELKRLGANINCYIPDRHKEGYGLNKEGIKKLREEKKCKLIITVDCGITAVEEVAYAYSLGIEVIITDHHEAPLELPVCEAIIDAKVPGETYPFKELCGAGVAGKIVEALSGRDILKRYIDLMALATVADLVPLTGENRAIVAAGLAFMNKYPRPGICELSKYAKSESEIISSYHLGFRYAPMINACGRLGHASDCVNLLTTSNKEKIESLAKKLNDYNETRKQIEKELVDKCLEKINPEEHHKGIAIYGEDWEVGVIGIVASRILEIYNCPVIVLSYNKENKTFHGSGRSISGINLYEVLSKCSKYILQFGGHEMAAGLTVNEDKIDDFVNEFKAVLNSYDDVLFENIKKYDTSIVCKDISKKLSKELKVFEPTGLNNPKPIFLLEDVSMKEIMERGSEGKHFSCTIYDETANSKAIAFNQVRPISPEGLDVLCNFVIDSFNNIEIVKSQILSFKTSESKKERDLLNKDTLYGVRTKENPLAVLNITDKKIKQFEKNNIYSVSDLVNYFPRKYYDFRESKVVKEVVDKELCSIIGKIKSVKQSPKMVWAMCEDKNGDNFMVCWFHQPYIYKTLYDGQVYNFCGNIKIQDSGFVQMYPLYWDKDIKKLQSLIPVYKKIPGMSNDYLSTTMDKALKTITNTDYLDEDIVKDFNLLSEYDTYFYMHNPKSDVDIEIAQRRKVFDSLFKFNFILKDKLRTNDFSSKFIAKSNNIWNDLKKEIPYTLTPDQEKAINDMYFYMQGENRLNGLVQGDVGSGKTIVAFFMMVLGIENNFQSCIIAPTEVLAKQHFEELSELMKPFGVNVGYLTGSMKAREKKEVVKNIKEGNISLVVGTHAVLQDSVEFNNLGLVVIDEQHRFGVNQREKLLNNENKPHVITMSATPIPRTLSMALYGDNIQVYNIKTKPAGRKEVITKKMFSDEEINEFMLNEIKNGHQCYVVCPLIEDSESEAMSEVKSVTSVADSIKEYFKDEPLVKISDISGRMKQELISEEIRKFSAFETNILISTTIIEVGVNIPNATVMVIKSSERFGLAQAHQLRGRVGRGKFQSYCLLQTNKDDRKAEILCSSSDGFEIAKQDLLLRGPGDYIGTEQTGSNKDVMLMLAEPDLYKRISELNDKIYNNSALFARYKYILDDINDK